MWQWHCAKCSLCIISDIIIHSLQMRTPGLGGSKQPSQSRGDISREWGFGLVRPPARSPRAAPSCAQLQLLLLLTEDAKHALLFNVPDEGTLDFKSSFPVIFPDSRLLVLPQLFISTSLFPTPSRPLALNSMLSSLPLTFMSSTKQQQDRTEQIKENQT